VSFAFLLDRNDNRAILLAGILSLVIGIGVGRFAFTTLLPPMMEDLLDVELTGRMAAANYAGYLSGALFAVFLRDINAKVRWFRFGILLALTMTAVLGLSRDETLWLLSRVLAGFGTAMAMVVGSAIVMTKLDYEDKTRAMGIHFSGIGIAILSTDLLAKAALALGMLWSEVWLLLAAAGATLSLYVLPLLSFDRHLKRSAQKHALSRTVFSPFALLLIAAYFTEGVGFVVQATFLPDIIDSLPGLEGYGAYTWTLVGIAGIPSCILLMRLAHRYGSRRVIVAAMLLQAVGILLPAWSDALWLNLLSGLLYGGTFVGLVALFLHLGGKLAGPNPVVMMAALTAAYGIGQVSAPLYSAALYRYTGSYDAALWLTAGIVTLGALLLSRFGGEGR
jgi:MFS family permease